MYHRNNNNTKDLAFKKNKIKKTNRNNIDSKIPVIAVFVELL